MAEISRLKSRLELARAGGLPPDEEISVIEQPLWKVRLRLLWRNFKTNFRIFRENPIGLIGLAVIFLFAVMALIHPYLIGTVWDRNVYDPVIGIDQTIIFHPAPPSSAHPLGTDPLGRDVLSQLMFGTRAAFTLGILAAIVTVTIATTVGALSAYFGGIIDTIFMRLADLIIMTPTITILLVMAALFDIGFVHLALIIGVLGGFGGATIIIKSQALTIKVRSYIEAARVAGGGDTHIIFKHIIPNLLPLSFLYMMFTVTTAIALEAILSFFGLLNIRMSWGLMIFTTQRAGYLLDMSKWWLVFPSGLAITMLCAAFYLVGRALDEVVNPRLRKR
jgi:peptide/nickel transport system permease protein